MRELDFLKIINDTLSKTDHIGDDCAFLEDLGIVITQDSLVEDVHFCRKISTPYEIGYKSLIVNISDVLASGALPKYITISLSLPKDIDENFIREFYNACEDISKEYEIEIVGGDITGGEKVFVSVCAIGSTKGRTISSRSFAKVNDYIIVTGNHGSSAAGLEALQNDIAGFEELKNIHKMPKLIDIMAKKLSSSNEKYAMMDTSDGLLDATFKIAKASNKTLAIDFDKIPYDKNIEKVAQILKKDYKDWVLYGGEDYQLVACVSESLLNELKDCPFTIIGRVKEQSDNIVEIKHFENVRIINNLDKTFNHFN